MTMSLSANIAKDLWSTLRREDKARALSLLWAPSGRQSLLLALYSFNNEIAKIREQVSEAQLGEIRLTWWLDALEALQQGEARRHPVLQIFAAEITSFLDLYPQEDKPQKKENIFALLTGMVEARFSDLYSDAGATEAFLDDYIEGSGGNLARLAAIFLGIEGEAEETAYKLGCSWARFGLVRASAFQALRGQNFMPNIAEKIDLERGPAPLDAQASIDGMTESAQQALAVLLQDMIDKTKQELAVILLYCKKMPAKERPAFLLLPLLRAYVQQLEGSEWRLHDIDGLSLSPLSQFYKIARAALWGIF